MASALDLLARLTDNASARRVYGEPYERDGVTIIRPPRCGPPAAWVAGRPRSRPTARARAAGAG
jgi:hypothetical protein